MTKVIADVLKDKKLVDLVPVKAAKVTTKPSFTTAKVEDCLTLLLAIEANNGYLGVAERCGLTVSQVKEVHAEMIAKIQELTSPVEKEELTK